MSKIAAHYARHERDGNRYEHHQQKDRSPTEAIWRRMYAAVRASAGGRIDAVMSHYDMAILIAAAERPGAVSLLDCRQMAEESFCLRTMAPLMEPSIYVIRSDAGNIRAFGLTNRQRWPRHLRRPLTGAAA